MNRRLSGIKDLELPHSDLQDIVVVCRCESCGVSYLRWLYFNDSRQNIAAKHAKRSLLDSIIACFALAAIQIIFSHILKRVGSVFLEFMS